MKVYRKLADFLPDKEITRVMRVIDTAFKSAELGRSLGFKDDAR